RDISKSPESSERRGTFEIIRRRDACVARAAGREGPHPRRPPVTSAHQNAPAIYGMIAFSMRLPSTRTLRAFQLAARSGSFKTAASQLFLTPSAVSHQIRALEEELGVALFHRGARTLMLTDAGARYLEEIEYLFQRLDTATRELRARAGRSTLRLRVASFFANEFLLPRLAALHAAQPDIDLEIDTDGTGTDIHPADADVSIVLGSGSWSELQAHRLFPQAYVPACSAALFARTPITS